MSKILGNLGRAISESFADVSTQTSAELQRNDQLYKLEVKLKEIDIKIEKNCTLIGQLNFAAFMHQYHRYSLAQNSSHKHVDKLPDISVHTVQQNNSGVTYPNYP